MRKGIAALALVFLAAHLPYLPPTLEDIDSINFALGVRQFDVARHQPHPPGYPVFIALGKISTPLLRASGVPSPEPRGLAVWSAVAGAALVLFLFAFFRALSSSDFRSVQRQAESPADSRGLRRQAESPADSRGFHRQAESPADSRGFHRQADSPADSRGFRLEAEETTVWATAIAVLSPLFWFTALRPLSDTSGLAAAVAAQALILSAMTGRTPSRVLLAGALLSGLAIGIRSQTFLLTLPLLALALVVPGTALRARDRLGALAACVAGALAWAIPLIIASGGLSAYAAALGTQAGEDFSGVVMLWTMRKPRVAVDALMGSFVWPWGHPVVGAIVVVVALAGVVRLAFRMPRALGLLVVGFVPYAIFHLLFHEPVTVRYALPLVVPVAYLVAVALSWPGRAALRTGAAALIAWSLILSVPAMSAYGRDGSPAFRALGDAVASAQGEPPVVGMHAVTRRASDWIAGESRVRILKAPHGREWLTLIEQWKSAPDSVVEFVADPRRTDLALFDPLARTRQRSYRWGFVEPPFVGGARPGDTDRWRMNPPGWMLDRGWALTAEIAGVTARDGLGPHKRPSVAWIRARGDDALAMIGGRHLGPANDPPAHISLVLNGRPLDSFDVKPGFFFRLVPVAAGALAASSAYVPLEVSSAAADGSGRELPVGLEQFDLQSGGAPMIGAGEGWYEPEYDPRTSRAWRWTSAHATLWVRPIGRDVTLTLAGESPLRYFDAPPTVKVTVGGREVASFTLSTDFTREVTLPAAALAAADGQVIVESSRSFSPGNGDPRHLALRIYDYRVK